MPRAGPSFRSNQAIQRRSCREEGEVQENDATNEDEVDLEDDQDGDSQTEDGASFRGVKRVKLNKNGDTGRSVKGKEKEIMEARIKTLPRDVDGYIPGSIVRVQLKNFVTYDFVEFRPGPYLNMILGPNGTGKSSIACAICLGLNFPPSVLGRASEINSFVKQGAQTGHIEIELKGKKGRGNLVIRRCIKATTKSTQFFLNGQSSSGKEINEKMRELNVQVGNMCSFLPQDKVSEFAHMTPQQLLRETQRAAGDEHLTTWHDTLIDAGQELKRLSEVIKEDNEQLGVLLQRNEGIERDVQRFKDRERIQRTIGLLNILIPVRQYQMLRLQFLEAKKRQRKSHQKVMELKEKNQPAHNLLKKLDSDLQDHEKIRDKIKKVTMDGFQELKKKWTDCEKLEQVAEEFLTKLDNLEREEKERVRRIKSLEQDIFRLQEELAEKEKVKPEKIEDLKEEMNKLHAERNEIFVRKDDVNEKLRQLIDRMAFSETRLSQAQEELKKLDDVNIRKMQALRQWDQATHDAVVWLRCHRHLFKMEVIEPPFLCLTVSNKDFVQAVEGCISAMQLKTFVPQCQEDLDTFNHWINDTDKALGRKVQVATWFRVEWERNTPPPPMSPDELYILGFDGYALEYVDCPPGLRSFLQGELNFHRTAIARDSHKVDVNRAMEAAARHVTGSSTNFICGTTVNQVSRSRYGRKAITNVTREIGPARFLGNSSIDPEVKIRIDVQMQESKQSMGLLDEEKKILDEDLKNIEKEDGVFHERAAEINKRRDAVKKLGETKARMALKLKQDRVKLISLQNHPPPIEERSKIRRDVLRVSQKRIKIAKEYTGLGRSIVTEFTEATRVGIKYLQVNANKIALDTLCKQKDAKYTAAMEEFNEADNEFQRIKSQSKDALDQSREVIETSSQELREEYHTVQNARSKYEAELEAANGAGRPPPNSEGIDLRTLDELLAELERQKTDLELNMATDGSVVEQYERRKREIAALEKKVAEQQRKVEKVEKNINNARDNWKPALEKLVSSIGEKFSLAFDRFGCAGEIRVGEHEDYSKWAIDILVKFRDTEKLQILTAQRQSGGERSLTTILYLLSLSEEARAPFSLVDEINQGMDRRAERTVHNNMVEVTCKSDSAQYFLITPKLLPDLNYHERMKILFVNNGEWLPEEPGIGNMMSMIDGFVQRRSQSASLQ